MFLREAPNQTLTTLRDNLESTPGETIAAVGLSVSVALADRPIEERVLRVNETEIPFTSSTLEAITGWVGVPKPFLKRQDPEFQEFVLNYLLRSTDEGLYRYTDGGLLEVRTPGQKVIDPRQVIDIMAKVIDGDASVVDFWATPDEFRLDTIVPQDFDRGIGGDRQVGDLTRGGIRVVQNRKQNHAPALSEFYYRLICTNGMEVQVDSDKIDARGESVEDVLMAIEMTAQRIMGRIEDRIDRFYHLRSEMVRTPEQAILRMADEQGISDRVVTSLIEAVPTITNDNFEASMFDLVNLVTNYANEPSVDRRSGARLLLERAGGTVVHDHAERCGHCQSRLTP